MWFLLWSGVFERYPGLQFAVTEGGAGGSPTSCGSGTPRTRREHTTKKMGSIAPKLTMLPSEYIDRNVKIGSSNMRRREIERRYEIGVGNIMWGNDFPHPEGTWPHTKRVVRGDVLRLPGRRHPPDPRAQRGRVLRLRRRQARAARRAHRPDAGGVRPGRRRHEQVGRPARRRAPLALGQGSHPRDDRVTTEPETAESWSARPRPTRRATARWARASSTIRIRSSTSCSSGARSSAGA